MDNINVYSRQESLNLPRPRLAVVGCGGVGTWAAIFAALSGIREITLVDADVVEPSNLNRLPYPLDAVGKRKVDVLMSFILRLRPETQVLPVPERFSPEVFLLRRPEVVIDATDSVRAQRDIQAWARGAGIFYIRAGCEVDHFTVTSATVWGDAQDGYDIVPSWCVPHALAAAFAVAKAMWDRNIGVSASLKDFVLQGGD